VSASQTNASANRAFYVDAVKHAASGHRTFDDTITVYEEEEQHHGTNEVAPPFGTSTKFRDWATVVENPLFKKDHVRV